MKRYFFVLGTTVDLCKAELVTVLSRFPSTSVLGESNSIIIVESSDDFKLQSLIEILGGTVKIAQFENESLGYDQDDLLQRLEQTLPLDAKTIGLSNYSHKPVLIEPLLATLKKIVQEKGKPVRYIAPQKESVLSSVVVQKQQVTEFILLDNIQKSGWLIGKTIAVQNSDAWTKRDIGRPGVDAQSGMLPLKVARMMVNLAGPQKKTLLDPFCGMGSILQEGLLLGFTVIGSDVSAEAVLKAQSNIEWLSKHFPQIRGKSRFLTANAVHLSRELEPNSIDVIVTEPFLGAPYEHRGERIFQKGRFLTKESLHNTFKGLEKLYIGALKEWFTLLSETGVIVIILPEVEFQGQVYRVKKIVDNCEKFGYTLSQGPFHYSRPQAVVKRAIYVFKKSQITMTKSQ